MPEPPTLLEERPASDLPAILQAAGVAGAGGAGFPTYAKWTRLDDVDHLLMNHQESEPIFYKDRWLGREHADAFAALFDGLLSEGVFESVVVAAKATDRDAWVGDLEAATDATAYLPGDLPLDQDQLSGAVFAYTDDRYQFGMENVLLRLVADVVVGTGLPMDHSWIVQNTETLYNAYRAFADETPVTRKYVHVDGPGLDHRFLDVPVGTPATAVLDAAGLDHLGHEQVLVDGGPGWCFGVEEPPDRFGVRKRTNCLLALDRAVADANTFGGERVDVRNIYEWAGPHETGPTEQLEPEYVRVPRVTNAGFRGLVFPSDPVVEPGDGVDEGDVVAKPNPRGFSNAQHAPIDGTVASVTATHVEIRAP